MRPPQPSARVCKLLEGDWSPILGGLGAAQWFTLQRRPNEGESRFLDVYVGDRHVQVYVSPAGRSVRVFVDGDEALPRPER